MRVRFTMRIHSKRAKNELIDHNYMYMRCNAYMYILHHIPKLSLQFWLVYVSTLCVFVFTGSLFEEYCALAEYEAEDPSQVSFTSGQIVLVLNKHESGMILYTYIVYREYRSECVCVRTCYVYVHFFENQLNTT